MTTRKLIYIFSSVYMKDPDWTWILCDKDKLEIEEILKLKLTKEGILQKLLKLNANKSPGPNTLQPRVIKHLCLLTLCLSSLNYLSNWVRYNPHGN